MRRKIKYNLNIHTNKRKYKNINYNKPSRLDYITAICTMLTVIISAISTTISALSTIDFNKEKVNMYINDITIKDTAKLDNTEDWLNIPLECKVVISNNSQKSISIVKGNVYQFEDDHITVINKNLIKNIYSNNEEKNFPITLNSGESILINLELRYCLEENVRDLIYDKYTTDVSEVEYKELWSYLWDSEVDIYGNTYCEWPVGGVMERIFETVPKYPKFLLNIKTSKNKEFKLELDCKLYN